MAKLRPRKIALFFRQLPAGSALALVCALCVWAASRYDSQRLVSNNHISRSSQRQASRLLARLRVQKIDPTERGSARCFASSEEEARDKLMESMKAADPDDWNATMSPSSVMPPASMFVCTDGLREEEVAAMNKVLYDTAEIKPRLVVKPTLDHELDSQKAHALIQSYLGRERYIEHIAKCYESGKVEDQIADEQLDIIVEGLLNLSDEQRAAFRPIKAKLRGMPGRGPMEVLDEHGDMVALGAAPETDTEKEYQTLLIIAEEGFAILTEEQRRKYKELVTHPAYANVFAQFRLIQRFLPVPEEIRETLATLVDEENSEQ